MGKNLGFKRKKRGEIGIAMERVRTLKEGDDRVEYLPMSKKRDDKKSLSLLPLDLIIEILTRLPPKSVSKLIFVSKLWLSIIQSKHFTELYLTRSSTRPCLVFEFYCGVNELFFHYASQEDPSSDHRANTSPLLGPPTKIHPPVRGLICSRYGNNLVISNPSTGQSLTLPKANTKEEFKLSFFGYDPVNDLYKVLCVTVPSPCGSSVVSEEHQVFSLGGAQETWRMIDCKHPHYPLTQGLCKNGVVYYGAWDNSSGEESLLVSFDLRFEEFSLIALPEDVQIIRYALSGLVNYNGKIALVDQSSIGKFAFWVLEDVRNQEWSKVYVTVPCWINLAKNDLYHHYSGTVSNGELVFSPCSFTAEFCVIYYDPKEDKARRVEFQIRKDKLIGQTVFLDHIESPMFLPRNFIR